MATLTNMFGGISGTKPDNDFAIKHERQDRVGIFCAVCGLEETFYNMKVEKDQRTADFQSEIYLEPEADYLLYFCSDKCLANKPLRADERVPDNRKYKITDNEPEDKPDPTFSF